MIEQDTDRDPVEELAAEFVERHRSGECPTISEYVAAYPDHADEIRELFPTIANLEKLKLRKEVSSDGRASLGAARIERLGDFSIIREIGRGGMGIVYEAEQESLGRRVAIKVLPKQSLLNPRQLARFQREAQTAARLHHTNIVPVFGVGEHDGYHFIVMQLIRGVGMDEVVSELRDRYSTAGRSRSNGDASNGSGVRSSANSGSLVASVARSLLNDHWRLRAENGTPLGNEQPTDNVLQSNNGSEADGDPDPNAVTIIATVKDAVPLSGADQSPNSKPLAAVPGRSPGILFFRSVAALAHLVADAIAYAHGQNTLHRDIKPANLLLDEDGSIWVADFGLAKATENRDVSQTGDVVGTLRYMAPEQLKGHADVRSDIYSFGLTLYELLTLTPAFDDMACRQALSQPDGFGEPVRPRKVFREIPRDLETIVLKAIAPEPERRYQSAEELAVDLQCFLEDRPIHARRVTSAERLWRWCRRNRLVSLLSGTALALLILVALVSTVGYVNTNAAKELAEDRLEGERAERERAEKTLETALEALDTVYRRFAPDRLSMFRSETTFESEDDDTAAELLIAPVLSPENAEFLEGLLAAYDQLAEHGGNSLRLREEAARANRRVGDIKQRLGDYADAEVAYRRSIEQYTTLLKQSTEPERIETEIARIQNELGTTLRKPDTINEARECYLSAYRQLTDLMTRTAAPEVKYELARTCYLLSRREFEQLGAGVNGPGGRGPGFGPGIAGPGPSGPGMGGPGPGMRPGPGGPPRGRTGNNRTGNNRTGNDRTGGDRDSGRRGTEERGTEEPGNREPGSRDRIGGRRRPDGEASPRGGFRDRSGGFGDRRHLNQAIEILTPLHMQFPRNGEYQHLLAICYGERGFGFNSEDDQQAIALLEQLVSRFPEQPDYRHDLIGAWAASVRFFSDANDDEVQLAESRLRHAVTEADRLVQQHPNIPDYKRSRVEVQLQLCGLLAQKAHGLPADQRSSPIAEVEALCQNVIEIQTALADRYPDVPHFRVMQVFVTLQVTRIRQSLDREYNIEPSLLGCIETLGPIRSGADPSTAGIASMVTSACYGMLARSFEHHGDHAAAEDARAKAADLMKSVPRDPRSFGRFAPSSGGDRFAPRGQD